MTKKNNHIASALHILAALGILNVGPGSRTGALDPITSVSFRDPDGNFIEVSSYHDSSASRDERGKIALPQG